MHCRLLEYCLLPLVRQAEPIFPDSFYVHIPHLWLIWCSDSVRAFRRRKNQPGPGLGIWSE